MNFCPKCGFYLRGIREAIDKEKEIWRPWDYNLPDYYKWFARDDSGTSDTLPYEITVT